MKLILKIIAVLILIPIAILITILLMIEYSGRSILLSEINHIPQSGITLPLDIPSNQGIWHVMIALSKEDQKRLRQMNKLIEVSIENSSEKTILVTMIEKGESVGKALNSNEKKTIFNGEVSDLMEHNAYHVFMDNKFYKHSEYDSLLLLKTTSKLSESLILEIKPSDEIHLKNKAVIFAFIPKDSI